MTFKSKIAKGRMLNAEDKGRFSDVKQKRAKEGLVMFKNKEATKVCYD